MKLLFVHWYKAVIILLLLNYANITLGQSCSYVWFDYSVSGCNVEFNGHTLGNIDTWFWEFGDGSTSSDQVTNHYFSEPGCYSIVLTVNDGESFYEEEVCIACQDGIGNNNGNTGGFNVSIAGPNTIYTSNLGTTYTAEVSGGTAPYEYSWNLLAPDNCGSIDDLAQSVEYFMNSCTLGTTVIELCVTDYYDNQSCTTKTITRQAPIGNCAIDVSGALEVGEKVDMRILGQLLGPDCFDAYPYWTWSYGDGVTEGPMFWITEHTYQGEGIYTVTAQGCVTPYDPTNCVTITTQVRIQAPTPDVSIPNFAIAPVGEMVINLGESSGTNNVPLSVQVNNLPADVPGKLLFKYYEVQWRIVEHQSQNTVALSPLYSPITPTQLLESQFTNFTFTPDAGMWGCLDVILEIYPWGYYNGPIDIGCDDEVGNDAACGGDCIGILGEIEASNLSIRQEPNEWGIGVSGCVRESQYGYEFPFRVIENCKIEVVPKEPEILDIQVHGTCDPYLSVETTLGAMEANPIPTTAPCLGNQDFPEYRWTALSIFDPTEELDLFLDNDGLRSCISIDRTHEYFSRFSVGQQMTFICKVEVEDHFGLKDSYVKPIALEAPLVLHLSRELLRCPETVTELSNRPIISGGVGPFDFDWGELDPYILGDCPDCQLDLSGLNDDEISFTLKVTDEGQANCEVSQEMKLLISPLTISTPVTDINACQSGPGANQLEAEVYGGSGEYMYQWSPERYLLDPYASSTGLDFDYDLLFNQGPLTQTYTLLVTDEYGCTNTSSPITATGAGATLKVDAGKDQTICHGVEETIGFIPTDDDSESNFYWTSDNEHFSGANTPRLTLSESLNSHPGTYIYTLHGIVQPSGCIYKDEVVVTVLDQWAYQGYESGLDYLVRGVNGVIPPVRLWDSNLNDFLDTPQPSGHEPPLSFEWIPDDETFISNDQFNDDNIPAQGTFVPSLEHPYLRLRVRDQLGCFKDLKTNRYLVLNAEPVINIVSDQSIVVCQGEEICFEIELNTHFEGDGATWLPSSMEVQCNFNILSSDQALELNLMNGQGVYQGQLCVSDFSGPWQPGINHTLTVSTLGTNELFAGLSTTYLFQVGLGREAAPDEIVCGDLQTTLFPPQNINYTAQAMNIQVGIDEGNCDHILFLPGYYPAFRAGTSITFYPDNNFNNLNGGQMIAFIDPCMVEEEFTETEEESIGSEESLKLNPELQNTLQKNRGLHDMFIFPNPFTNEITIRYSLEIGERSEGVSLYLLDVTGTRIVEVFAKKEHNSGVFTATHIGGSLMPGMYFYELNIGDDRIIRKAIKTQF